MIFFLSVIAIFVAVSIYFFFKAENLHRSLLTAKREVKNVKNESKALADNFAVIAQRNQDFAQQRLNNDKSENKESEIHRHLKPLVSNYATIFTAAAKGKGELHKTVKKCLDNYEAQAFQDLKKFIGSQEAPLKRMWSSNNVQGFMALVESLLLTIEKNSNQR